MPLCFGASRSVRASTKHQSLQWASDVHTFWPLSTHSSPSQASSARVWMLARSEPAFGLGVALAPQLVARAGWRAGTAACCSGDAEVDERRARSGPRRCGRAAPDRRPGRTPRSR